MASRPESGRGSNGWARASSSPTAYAITPQSMGKCPSVKESLAIRPRRSPWAATSAASSSGLTIGKYVHQRVHEISTESTPTPRTVQENSVTPTSAAAATISDSPSAMMTISP